MSKIGAERPHRGIAAADRFVFKSGNCPSETLEDGGAYRDRTDDLKLAKLALSQLS